MAKRYPAKVKFQVVLELLQGEKTIGQIAKAYGVHPNSIHKWKKDFLEKGAEVLISLDQSFKMISIEPFDGETCKQPSWIEWIYYTAAKAWRKSYFFHSNIELHEYRELMLILVIPNFLKSIR